MDAETEAEIVPEYPEYPEAGPFWVGLWAVARHWAAMLEQIFEPDVIARTGITRSFAVRCGKWLWAIEGLIRRLIIAAAMKLDAAQLPAPVATKPRPAKPAKPAITIAFAVLPRLPGRGAPSRPPPLPAPEHRHLVLPGDGLLSLFPRHRRRNAPPAASVRTRNPLQRRGRRNRWDPDYTGGGSLIIREGDGSYGAFSLYGRQAVALEGRAPPPRAPRKHGKRQPARRWQPGDPIPEWKRVELEWERIIPSPRLGARIAAVLRVLEKPERWIERTARRLAADAFLVTRLSELPAPHYRKHKLDRGADPPLLDVLAQADALRFDTS